MRVALGDGRTPAVDSGEGDRSRTAAAHMHPVAVDEDVVDPRPLRRVVGARVQGLQERVRIGPLRADLDPRPEAIGTVMPVRIVSHGDVEPVPAREQRVDRVAAFGLIRP